MSVTVAAEPFSASLLDVPPEGNVEIDPVVSDIELTQVLIGVTVEF